MSLICFFNTTVAWGGGEKWHLETSRYMWENGHPVLLMAHSGGELYKRARELGIPCEGIAAGNLSFLNPFKLIRLRRFMKNRGVRTLIMNLSRDVKLAGLSAKWAGIRRIIYRRGSDIPVRNSFLNRYLFGKVLSEVLVNSRATSRSLLKNNPELFPEDRITIFYNGLDFEGFDSLYASETGWTFRPEGVVHLITLGRLEQQKNHSFLLKVCRLLLDRGLDFRLHIGGEGRLRERLEAEVAALGLEKIVTLHGFINEPIPFLMGGDIFVLPSLWEGFGYVLAEAAYCELPVVAFDLSSNPEVIPHEKAGILTEAENVEAFGDAIEKLLRDPDLRKNMGKYARDYVTTTFERKKILAEIEAYLTQ